MRDDTHDHDHGLAFDLERLQQQRLGRRDMLVLLGGGSALLASLGSGAAAAAELCIADAPETNGPYPADGSNTAPGSTSNLLTESGVVRSDIRSSFGTSTSTAPGVQLTLNITIGDAGKDCAPLPGYAIYLWHCTQDGLYSLYTLPEENFLRGVQVAGEDGTLSFTTIFPGCYRGRWPHIHFEIYPSLEAATDHGNAVLTSQFALPAEACSSVYDGVAGYEASVSTFADISMASDNVFRDNSDEENTMMTPTVSGSVADGFVATAVIAIAV